MDFKLKIFILLNIGLFKQPYAVTSGKTDMKLYWYNITDAEERGALCNDFSTAGFFLRNNSQSKKWVIFLESGGGCGSKDTCTERYIDQFIRDQYQINDGKTSRPTTDITAAYRDHGHNSKVFVSKFMTSLWNFKSEEEFSIEGRDLLSIQKQENPNFFDYNHVVIPYCSSDLFLGSSDNYKKVLNTNFHFNFNPNSSLNEFTFRGVAILKSTILDLWYRHGLNMSTDVLFAGSSAGGIGVLNHAKWFAEMLTSINASLSVIMESAWFINFHGNMERRFSPETVEYLGISTDSPCNDLNEGYPCCVSTHCMLSKSDFYPKSISTLVVFSLYDLYFLIDSIPPTVSEDSIALHLLRITSEYSGEMNASLIQAASKHPNLSFFVTSCLQHVYLATSSLWGGILGHAELAGGRGDKRFQ